MKKCWILSNAFSASIEIIIWFLAFNLLMWCSTLIDFQILKNPCIPGIKPTWSWGMIFLICCTTVFYSFPQAGGRASVIPEASSPRAASFCFTLFLPRLQLHTLRVRPNLVSGDLDRTTRFSSKSPFCLSLGEPALLKLVTVLCKCVHRPQVQEKMHRRF